MTCSKLTARLLASAGLLALLAAPAAAQGGGTNQFPGAPSPEQNKPAPSSSNQPSQAQVRLEQVATFEHQVTGVTVSRDGRIFVNFPRWTEDAPISVAEVGQDGALTPYPNEALNAWRNARASELKPEDHFVCVQSVVVDPQNNLWVVDSGSPGNERVLPNAAKLVKIDLATNKVVQTIRFDESVATPSSYLNDIRFSPDGSHAYLTDSGNGALIVVDLKAGKGRRVLDGHPSTQAERDVVVKVDGKELRRTDGRAPMFHADGIALTPNGNTLVWQALTGRTLYRIPTEALENANLSAKELEARVERLGASVVADGLLIDRRGRLFITSPEDNSVKLREADGRLTNVVEYETLRWPDTLAEGPDGTLYVTASHIQDSAWFKPEAGPQLRTKLFRFRPPE